MIAEQHRALTETFNSHWHFPDAKPTQENDFVGEVFLKCNASEVVTRVGDEITSLARSVYGPQVALPAIKLSGHLDATFPYIPSHLEYIIGELLRNSVQATVERPRPRRPAAGGEPPAALPPIEVTLCEAPQHVIIRVSDQGGGIAADVLPHLWAFSKHGARATTTLANLQHVPRMAATMQELRNADDGVTAGAPPRFHGFSTDLNPDRRSGVGPAPGAPAHPSSLSSLTGRPSDLRLGMGLPLSRVYAEYWAGSLELHSLEGYGVDAFLQISKLGNKNEQLVLRASMDAV